MKASCRCAKCEPIKLGVPSSMRLILCERCGNKRCPHAHDHEMLCLDSNEPNLPQIRAHPRDDNSLRSLTNLPPNLL